MKMSNRTTVVVRKVVGKVVFALVCLGLFAGLKAVNHLNAQKIATQNYNVDRDTAIQELYELRGMILEVESLSHKDIPRYVLLDELESITSPKHFTNPYLNFTFIFPNTSNIGELCEELILQIDNQVHTIEHGAKGE